MVIQKIFNAVKRAKLSQLSVKWQACHLCGWKIQLKINNDEMGVRCSRCFATPVSQSVGYVFNQKKSLSTKDVYELSSRGAFVKFLKKQNINLILSEFYAGIKEGEYYNGILCQNIEKLTFASNSFDICTSLEVFEHVENDVQGFKEVYRVLRKNGIFIFTVPINLKGKTTERTAIINGKRKNILPPEYHSDSINGAGKVFCFRNYGFDIIERLKKVGFNNCEIHKPSKSELFGFGRPVIIAKKF